MIKPTSSNELLWYKQYSSSISQSLESKLECKDQESIQSSTTPDPGYQWESGKLTVRHHKREPRGQPPPPPPPRTGDHKVHINRSAQRHRKHKTEKSIKDPQKK